MKQRITGILHTRRSRLAALLAAAALLLSPAGAAAASGQQGPPHIESAAASAAGFLTHPTGAAHLTGIPTDYEYAQLVYFSGVPAVMDEEIVKHTQLGAERWAHVRIPAADGETALSGYTPMENFVRQSDAPAFEPFPKGALHGGKLTGMAALYVDNGLTNAVLNTFPDGTQLSVLGFTKTHYHVDIEGQKGFVPRESVRFEGRDLERVRAAEPEYYDSITPGREADYEAMDRRLQELTDKYGDINEWSIPMRAKWSQEQIEAGTLDASPDIWVHLMPGEGDLTEDEARALADKALADQGVDPASFPKVFSYYYVENGRRGQPHWQFTYRAAAGHPDHVVRLDKQGAVEETRAIESLGGPYIYELDSLLNGRVVMPAADEITNTQAADKAWETFAAAIPCHKARDAYDMTAALREQDRARYWMVTIQEKPSEPGENIWYAYHVALRAANGVPLYATDGDSYLESVKSYGLLRKQEAMEKEKGPLFTWSLEDKAALYPDLYALPREGHLTQQQAWDIAVEALKAQKGWTDDLLKEWKPYFFLARPESELPLRWDIQVYTEKAITEGDLDGYFVCVDAVTGEVLWVYGPGETNG